MHNVETVKEVYAAYARGDMATILTCVSEDVEWENSGAVTDVPWLAPQTGHAGVARFFEAVSLLHVNQFQPKTFLEVDHLVIVLVDEDVTVKATGRRIQETDQIHLWSFDARGKIIRHRQRVDTHMNWAAFRDYTT
jgi:ketosteroid isomerase-like protein